MRRRSGKVLATSIVVAFCGQAFALKVQPQQDLTATQENLDATANFSEWFKRSPNATKNHSGAFEWVEEVTLGAAAKSIASTAQAWNVSHKSDQLLQAVKHIANKVGLRSRTGKAVLRIVYEETDDKPQDENVSRRKVAVMSRITQPTVELPYIASFVRHYGTLGATTMYLICKDYDGCEVIRNYLQTTATPLNVSLKDTMHLEDSEQDCLLQEDASHWRCVEEDYLLFVGPSEYLTLPPNLDSFKEFLDKHRITELFQFRWVIVPFDGQGDPPPDYRGFAASKKRYLVKKKALHKIKGTSAPPQCSPDEFGEGDSMRCKDFGPMLFNFQYRGVGDCALQDLEEVPLVEPGQGLLELIEANVSSTRMKHLAWNMFAASRLGPQMHFHEPLLAIDHEMLDNLLTERSVDLRNVREIYHNFKHVIETQGAWAKFAFKADDPSIMPRELASANMTELEEIYRLSLEEAARGPLGPGPSFDSGALLQTSDSGAEDSRDSRYESE